MTGAVVLVVIAAVVAGLYALDRKFWFVGTNDSGQVTLFRGLPYDLPLGISLYSPVMPSGVTLESVPPARRKAFTDHKLRKREDAESLVRAAAQGTLR